MHVQVHQHVRHVQIHIIQVDQHVHYVHPKDVQHVIQHQDHVQLVQVDII